MKTVNQLKKFNKTNRRIAFFLLLISIWALTSYIFYLRFPNNYLYPNFYAEDGTVFTQNLYSHGIVQSLFSRFNGYYIWGIYLIEYSAFLTNKILNASNIISLPRLIAVSSYLFLGATVTLPIILLRRYFSYPTIFIIVLASTLVPMPSSDYAVIGTIGNLKYAFSYIALILILYRWKLPPISKKNYLVDAAILICGYTNLTVYLFLPLLLVGEGVRLKQLFLKSTWQISNNSLNSAIILITGLSIQLAVIKIHGIPKLPGYLDQPLHISALPEILLGRTLFYPLEFWHYSQLRIQDLIVLMILFIVAVAIWIKGNNLCATLFSVYASLTAVGLFLAGRTGLSLYYLNFNSSGPDQFFYAANLCAVIAMAFILQASLKKIQPFIYSTIVVFLAIFLLIKAPLTSSFGKNNVMYYENGDIYQNVKTSCEHSKLHQKAISIPIYPAPPWQIKVDTRYVCKSKTN